MVSGALNKAPRICSVQERIERTVVVCIHACVFVYVCVYLGHPRPEMRIFLET